MLAGCLWSSDALNSPLVEIQSETAKPVLYLQFSLDAMVTGLEECKTYQVRVQGTSHRLELAVVAPTVTHSDELEEE
jgi:hypothetical protein